MNNAPLAVLGTLRHGAFVEYPAVPITAFSLACGLGRDTESVLRTLDASRRGLTPPPFEVPFEAITGTIPGDLPPLPESLALYESRTARVGLLGLQGIQSSIAAAIERYGAHRVCAVLGTSTGGIDRTEVAHFAWHDAGFPSPPSFPVDYAYGTQHPFHAFAEAIRISTGIDGFCYVVSTACSSSAKVFASARRLLQAGIADAVLVGGVDGLCHTTVRGFHSLGVMASEPCRPFGENRPGMNVGEAGAFLLLERSSSDPLAYLLGVGETSDAYHMSSPDPEGHGAERAMSVALSQGKLLPSDVDYVNAHGTGTSYNDASEAIAIERFLGREVPVVSTKAYTGHTLGACGAVEAIFAIHATVSSLVPEAIGSTPVDPAVNLHLPSSPLKKTVRYVLSNSFAFGGNNASVLIGAAR